MGTLRRTKGSLLKNELKSIVNNKISQNSVILEGYIPLDYEKDEFKLNKMIEALSSVSSDIRGIDFYQTFFEFVPFTYSISSLETGKLVFCNENFSNLHGFESIEDCLKSFKTEVFYKNKLKRDKFIEHLRANRGRGTYEVCITDLSEFSPGRWFRLSSYLDQENGLLISIGIEVTEQKRSEEVKKQALKDLQHSEETLRSFFENAQAGFFRSNFYNGEILDCNAKFAEIMGCHVLNHDQCLEQMKNVFLQLNYSDSWGHLVEIVRERGSVSNFEIVTEKVDGSIVYLSVSCSLSRASGILEGAITNITEKKQALKALFQTELRYKNITEKTNGICAQYVFTRAGGSHLNFMGGKVSEYFTQSVDSIYGYPLSCFNSIHRKDRKRFFRSIFRNAFASEPWNTKIRIINAKMELKWLQVTATPTSFVDGDVIWSLVAIDITEQERFESERESLEKQIRMSQKMEALGTLAGGIAHDFNNILQGITFAVESSMMDKAMSDKTHDRLHKAQKFLNRGSDLVKQILTYCRRENQEFERICLENQLDEVMALMTSGLPKNVKLEKTVLAHSCLVQASPVQIQQVMMNLCTNAGYVMRDEGGKIELKIHETYIGPKKAVKHKVTPGSYIVLSVKDDGPGISKEVQERIFEPFYTTKPVGEGTGMGLAVVAGIVEAHHGFIEVHSVLSQGSIFNLFFPIYIKEGALESAIEA